MNMKANITIIFAFAILPHLLSQNTFIKSMPSTSGVNTNILTLDNNQFSYGYIKDSFNLNTGGTEFSTALLFFDENGNISLNRVYKPTAFTTSFDGLYSIYKLQTSGILMQVYVNEQVYADRVGVLKVNSDGTPAWYRQIRIPGDLTSETFQYHENNLNNNIQIAFGHDNSLGFVELDALGVVQKNIKITLSHPDFINSIFSQSQFFQTSQNEKFIIGRNFQYQNSIFSGLSIIQKINAQEEIETIWSIPKFAISSINETSGGNLILVGDYRLEEANDTSLVTAIIKATPNGEVLWSKIIPLDGLKNTLSSGCLVEQDEIVIIAQKINYPYSTLIKLDSNGEIILGKIYPGEGITSTRSQIRRTPDNGLFFMTRQSYFRTLLYKTDLNGEIEDKEIKDFCFEQPIDIELSFRIEDFSIEDGIPGGNTLAFTSVDLDFSDDTPVDFVYPTPFFNLPDILCANQCSAPTGLENDYADSQNWYTQGAETELHESKDPGQLCWDIPGTYQVQQIISFQNCLDTFEQFITIVPEIEATLPDTLTFCPNDEISINGYSENALNYLWSTGETSALIEPTLSGLYTLTTDNQYCSTIDSVSVQLTAINYAPSPVGLLQDTILCTANFPFDISVDLPYSENGMWEDGSNANPRTIYTGGNFTFTTEIDGCTFSKTMSVSEKNCQTQIYLPTAFSPNHDGINDTFEPQGSGFKVLDFSIYNRWGALVFQSNTSSWNGEYKGRKLGSDVFIYVMEWKNIDTGETGIEKGSVQLIR